MGVLSELEGEFHYEIVDEFVSSLTDMCEIMEPTIISLKSADSYSESTQVLFRIFHTLKSTTAFLKLNYINKLCILVEDELSVARELKGPASDQFVDWLLMVEDQFNQWLNDIKDDNRLSEYNPEIIKIPTILEI